MKTVFSLGFSASAAASPPAPAAPAAGAAATGAATAMSAMFRRDYHGECKNQLEVSAEKHGDLELPVLPHLQCRHKFGSLEQAQS